LFERYPIRGPRDGIRPWWLRGFCALLALAFLTAAWLAAFTARAEPQEGAPRSGARPEPAKAERNTKASALFARRCARCHDTDGTGGPLREQSPQMPDFTRARWHARHDDTQLFVSILEGKGSKMPSFRGRVSEDEAKELVSLIRTFDPSYDPAKAGGTLSGDDFSRRFRELEGELERLKKEYKELAPPAKP
jgi:mono/diheme cytochrome c family protein